jgi:hypothetical protein
MAVQAPGAVLLIRPHHFTPNPITAEDNVFQVTGHAPGAAAAALSRAACGEVTGVAPALEAEGIRVHLFDDEDTTRPDSVFPNNWLSTHAGGRIAVHPMYAENRRTERRWDIVELLKRVYRVQDVIDYSGLELDDVFLEGTGAMVLDHGARIAYVARSRRADPIALERFCTTFGYEPMVFDAADPTGVPIYHTNVMMCIGTEFALVGRDLITSERRRLEVAERLGEYGRTVIDLTFEQVVAFAGNALELRSPTGRVLAISSRGLASLRPEQVAAIEESCRILPLDVATIELAGGSVRCMLAGIHLDARPTRVPSPNVHTPSHSSGPSVHTPSHSSGPVIHRGMPLG